MLWVTLDPDGAPAQIHQLIGGSAAEPPVEGAVSVPDLELAVLMKSHLVDGAWQTRPECPVPDITALTGGGLRLVWETGGTALVRDHRSGVTCGEIAAEDGRISFDLVDAGSYEIDLAPPFPMLPTAFLIEVNR